MLDMNNIINLQVYFGIIIYYYFSILNCMDLEDL
jgi:hypothetical protein